MSQNKQDVDDLIRDLLKDLQICQEQLEMTRHGCPNPEDEVPPIMEPEQIARLIWIDLILKTTISQLKDLEGGAN